MKKYLVKTTSAFIIILTLIISAIPFASAATVLDETRKVSVTLNCSKPGYGIYKKHGRESFLDAAEYYSCHVNPNSVEKTIDEMESRWYDRSHTLTEAEKMVEDYNNGNTILNNDCFAFVDAGQSFGM